MNISHIQINHWLIKGKPVVNILAKFISWIVIVGFTIFALNALKVPAIGQVLEEFILYLPNVFVGLIILFFGYLLSNFLGRAVLIAGVNAGLVGFLTTIDLDNLEEMLERLKRGEYEVEERIKLQVQLNEKRLLDCTNEGVIHTSNISKMRHFEIMVDDNFMADIRADGIIVATPTGSTCYAMSVGSPLVDPRVNAFVIAPIAPFKLSARPYVVPIESEISIKLLEPDRPCILVLDGQYETQVASEGTIKFTVSENPAELVRFSTDFYKRVSEKLVL